MSELSIAVLISGSGRTLRNLITCVDLGSLTVNLSLVLSSRPQAGGLKFAQDAEIDNATVSARQFDNPEAFSEAVFGRCRDAGIDLVVMGGFMSHVLIPPDFTNRVMNIHPALIPAFCGKGFYGGRVHQAVLDDGVKVSGCTVHFVDNQYDHGPIILQKVVPVLDDDTVDSLAKRVFAEERLAYPEAIQSYADGRLSVRGRTVVLQSA